MKKLALVFLTFLTVALSTLAPAQERSAYPERAVRVVVPFAVGTPGDFVARAVSKKMTELLGKPFVVENRPGARGEIGVKEVLNSNRNGYALCHCNDGQLTINPAGYLAAGYELPYDPHKDLIPIGNDFAIGLMLAVNKDLPVRNMTELVALVKKNPGKLGIGASGPTSFLIAGLLKSAGLNMTLVPYSLGGEAESITGLLGNHIQVLPVNTSGIMGHVPDGSLRIIGAATQGRNPFFPEIPTLGEQGFRDFDKVVPAWGGLFAPRGTPAEVVAVLSRALKETMSDPLVMEPLRKSGIEPRFEAPHQVTERLNDIEVLVDLLRRTGTVLITK